MTTFIEIDERAAGVIMVVGALVLLAIGAPGLFDQLVVGPLGDIYNAIRGAY